MPFRLLRLEFRNISVFSDEFVIDFTASDRVVAGQHVSSVTNVVSSQNIVALVGINAAGKTSALRLVDLALSIVASRLSLDQIPSAPQFLSRGSIMVVDFFQDGMFYRLESEFTSNGDRLVYADERLYGKRMSLVRSRARLFEYSEDMLINSRMDLVSRLGGFMKDDDSIVMALTAPSCPISGVLSHLCERFSFLDGAIEPAYLHVFDRSLDEVCLEDGAVRVRFTNDGSARRVRDDRISDLLSSGTIKGTQLFHVAADVLAGGGYLLIDEIEDNLNKRLVQLLIDFFQDGEVNTKGAVLVFSTHYAEIVDSVKRKDNIYVMRKSRDGGCSTVRYSDVIGRNDVKKSEVLLSNLIEGTAPSYEDVQAVKDFMYRRISG